jgi:hypothetical protein
MVRSDSAARESLEMSSKVTPPTTPYIPEQSPSTSVESLAKPMPPATGGKGLCPSFGGSFWRSLQSGWQSQTRKEKPVQTKLLGQEKLALEATKQMEIEDSGTIGFTLFEMLGPEKAAVVCQDIQTMNGLQKNTREFKAENKRFKELYEDALPAVDWRQVKTSVHLTYAATVMAKHEQKLHDKAASSKLAETQISPEDPAEKAIEAARLQSYIEVLEALPAHYPEGVTDPDQAFDRAHFRLQRAEIGTPAEVAAVMEAETAAATATGCLPGVRRHMSSWKVALIKEWHAMRASKAIDVPPPVKPKAWEKYGPLIQNKGDGNCMPRAVLQALMDREPSYDEIIALREETADVKRKDPNENHEFNGQQLISGLSQTHTFDSNEDSRFRRAHRLVYGRTISNRLYGDFQALPSMYAGYDELMQMKSLPRFRDRHIVVLDQDGSRFAIHADRLERIDDAVDEHVERDDIILLYKTSVHWSAINIKKSARWMPEQPKSAEADAAQDDASDTALQTAKETEEKT